MEVDRLSAVLQQADLDLTSPDENTHWQAAIALGQFCETEPQAI
jgi:hypothetical protein